MSTDRAHPTQNTGVSSPFRVAICVAIIVGLGQSLLVLATRIAFPERLIRVSTDGLWMTSVANVVLLAIAAGAVSFVVGRFRPAAAGAVVVPVCLFIIVAGPLMMVGKLHQLASLLLAIGVATQGARIARPYTSFVDVVSRRSVPWLIGAWLVLFAATVGTRELKARRAEWSSGPQTPSPNVILIVLDTVRAQNLSLYGYPRETSPRLDAFARSGVVFDRVFSTSPWTLPSHASMFSGRLPHELGADWETRMNKAHPTIAEVFAARGYASVGFVANLVYTPSETGLNRGFSRYVDYPWSLGMLFRSSWVTRELAWWISENVANTDQLIAKNATTINQQFLTWFRSRPRKPFFAFLNYFDAHGPYNPPPPFDRKFGSGARPLDLNTRRTWKPEEIQISVDAYDGAISYLDNQLGQVFDALQTSGELDNTIVVVTSDHGEQFGEHGLYNHANSLYRQLLHVPLVLRFPARIPAGGRIADPVSLIDLAATILDVAGISEPRMIRGQPLTAYWQRSSGATPATSPLIAEVSKGINIAEWFPIHDGSMQSVVMNGLHYIKNGNGSEELYDFERDKLEVDNLVNRSETQSVLGEARRLLQGARSRESTAQ